MISGTLDRSKSSSCFDVYCLEGFFRLFPRGITCSGGYIVGPPCQRCRTDHCPRAAVNESQVHSAGSCSGGLGLSGPVSQSARSSIPSQRVGNVFLADRSSFELAIVHRDARRTLWRFVGNVWSEADHLLEGESWILPLFGVLPCALLAHARMVRTLAHSARSISARSISAPIPLNSMQCRA